MPDAMQTDTTIKNLISQLSVGHVSTTSNLKSNESGKSKVILQRLAKKNYKQHYRLRITVDLLGPDWYPSERFHQKESKTTKPAETFLRTIYISHQMKIIWIALQGCPACSTTMCLFLWWWLQQRIFRVLSYPSYNT